MNIKTLNLKANMRGIKKCTFCGFFNGFRAKGCKNKACFLSNKKEKKPCLIDPIELISNNTTKVFSVRVKDKEINLRNFVEITDTTLSTENEFTSIVKRNAICFVDTCKYDRDYEIICKHVKSCTVCNKRAEHLEINKSIIDKLKLNQDLKDGIWNMYIENINTIPSLQRINLYTFAVKCDKNRMFPAGRLHIIVPPDGVNIKNLTNNYYCSCQTSKIKSRKNINIDIMYSSDKEFCFHILFLLTGIISSLSLKYEFQNFCNLFKHILDNHIIHNDLFTFEQNNIVANTNNNNNQSIVLYNEVENFLSSLQNDNDNESYFSIVNNLAIIQNKSIFDTGIESKVLNNTLKLENQNNNVTVTTQIKQSIHNKNDTLINKNEDVNTYIGKVSSNNLTTTDICCKRREDCCKRKKNLTWYEEQNCNLLNKTQLGNLSELCFDDWLNNLIAKINLSLDFSTKERNIFYKFNIHENMFTLLHNKFSANNKKRLPNSFEFIKLHNKISTKYIWLFNKKAILKNIFQTENISINFEKYLQKNELIDNYDELNNDLKKYKRIKPKTRCVFIRLQDDHKVMEKSHFIIKWTPNSYQNSQFGIIEIEYSIDLR